jgi:hypothetical protein|tara:strand:- start:408 stop:617 length:210 start_codon:yes stop_codon:yes gene_type:complete
LRIFIANFKQTEIMRFRNMHHGVAGQFRNQTGMGQQDYYQAGVAMAQAVFQEGGVNALLAFLAGYNAAG